MHACSPGHAKWMLRDRTGRNGHGGGVLWSWIGGHAMANTWSDGSEAEFGGGGAEEDQGGPAVPAVSEKAPRGRSVVPRSRATAVVRRQSDPPSRFRRGR